MTPSEALKQVLPTTQGVFPASIGLFLMVLAIAATDDRLPIKTPQHLPVVLFVTGLIQFSLSVFVSLEWAYEEDKGSQRRDLTKEGKFVSGAKNGLTLLLLSLILIWLFVSVSRREARPDKLSIALASYIDATTTGKTEVISQAYYGVMAACKDVKEIGNKSDRAYLQVQCARLAGTAIPRKQAEDVLQSIKGPKVPGTPASPSPAP